MLVDIPNHESIFSNDLLNYACHLVMYSYELFVNFYLNIVKFKKTKKTVHKTGKT